MCRQNSQEQMVHLQNPGQKKILKVKEDEFAYKGQEGKKIWPFFKGHGITKELICKSFLCPGSQEHVAYSSMVWCLRSAVHFL